MPLSALFFLMMGAGGFLVYSAVKDQHPWELFTHTLGAASSPAATVAPLPTSGPGQAAVTTITPAGQVVKGATVQPS